MSVIILPCLQCVQVGSSSQVAQCLICSDKHQYKQGSFHFPGNHRARLAAMAFMASCLMKAGNLRLILGHAGLTLNLNCHELIRVPQTNLKQMGGLLSLCFYRPKKCWYKGFKMPTADYSHLSKLQTTILAPLTSSLRRWDQRRDVYIHTRSHFKCHLCWSWNKTRQRSSKNCLHMLGENSIFQCFFLFT